MRLIHYCAITATTRETRKCANENGNKTFQNSNEITRSRAILNIAGLSSLSPGYPQYIAGLSSISPGHPQYRQVILNTAGLSSFYAIAVQQHQTTTAASTTTG
jgi:hypothetical protein